MLETALIGQISSPQAHTTPHKALKMVKNERMGGFVPKWEKITSETPETTLAQAQSTPATPQSDAALAYRSAPQGTETNAEFGFLDLVDIINPLQHVPIVGHLYREITGDEIKSSSRVFGGAIYGGGLGAAGGLVDAILIEETGNDFTGNAMNIALNRPSKTTQIAEAKKPEKQIEQAISSFHTPHEAITTLTLMSFSDLRQPMPTQKTEPQKIYSGGLYDL